MRDAEYVESIYSFAWDELNAYRLQCYPNDLMVITNADANAWLLAVAEFGRWPNEHQPANIEEILRKMGYVAVTGCYEGSVSSDGTLLTATPAIDKILIENVGVSQVRVTVNDEEFWIDDEGGNAPDSLMGTRLEPLLHQVAKEVLK